MPEITVGGAAVPLQELTLDHLSRVAAIMDDETPGAHGGVERGIKIIAAVTGREETELRSAAGNFRELNTAVGHILIALGLREEAKDPEAGEAVPAVAGS